MGDTGKAGLTAALWVCLWGICPAQSQPQDPACGDEGTTLSATRYLRALSIDLRGHLPSLAEYEAVEAAGEVTAADIEGMLESDAFGWQFVAFHRQLLWPYLGPTLPLSPVELSLDAGEPWGTGSMLWYRSGGFDTTRLRGAPYTGCRDAPEPDPQNIQPVEMEDGTRREGYVCIRPYFSGSDNDYISHIETECPDGEYKVCAYDAQAHLVSPLSGLPCDELINYQDPGCGCGPDLRWCGGYQWFAEPMIESYERQIKWVVDHDRPYYELLTEAPPYANGELSHYFQHAASYLGANMPISAAAIPPMDYAADADEWVPLRVGPHARGVLTHPVFLGRFMTQRGRADRYYNAFLCQPFQPPEGGIEVSGPADPDLQERQGCKYCHSIIEPAGAHWGRYGEYGADYLDPGRFPSFDAECLQCAITGDLCSPRCQTHYITEAPTGTELPWLGYLNAFLYRREAHVANIEAGPALMVRRHIVDGRLARCAAQNTVAWLTGRTPTTDEMGWVEALGVDFAESDFDFKRLVAAIVSSEFYRRVR